MLIPGFRIKKIRKSVVRKNRTTEVKFIRYQRNFIIRDNLTDIEVVLTDIGEITARDIAIEEQQEGLKKIYVLLKEEKVFPSARDLHEKEAKKCVGIIKVTSVFNPYKEGVRKWK